jgi:3-oxoacyl-[acyl-carrier protein] reductase
VDDGAIAGRRVVVTGRRPSLVRAIAGAARAADADVTELVDGDVTAVERVLDETPPDVLVVITPPSDATAFLAMSDDRWSAAVSQRILEPIRMARVAARRMRERQGGVLVLVGTLDALHAYVGHADASVAMGALDGLVRSLAVELAQDGIRANLVLAGPLDDGTAEATRALTDRTLLRSPSGRFTDPDEVAAAVLFVAGAGAAFMTGAALRVDAGWGSLNQAPDGMRFP